MRVSVIIPALNEEQSIGLVIAALPHDRIEEVIVVDNGSNDRTAEVAREAGARVVKEGERGYGAACLAGLQAVNQPEVVVFLDGDYSDYPEDLPFLLAPIEQNQADLVVGSRTIRPENREALTLQQRFGNWLATGLLYWMTGVRFTDLGPFRAIRRDALEGLKMQDRNYGWTVEMQLKAARKGLRCVEVPVRYRKRVGVSKISGTIKGSIQAGIKILWTLARHGVQRSTLRR